MSAVSEAPPAALELQKEGWRRTVSLVWTLALTDWKLRFYGSVLGYLWMLVRPFAFFGVIYVIFTEVAKVGAGIENYGVYVLFGLVLFSFFAEVTSHSVECLVQRENLLRKIAFPPVVIPLAVSLTAMFNLLATLVAVFGFVLANGIWPAWTWLELVPLLLLLWLLATGVGMLLSVLYLRYRDVKPIWDVLSQILFYASPVLYVATQVPEDFQRPYLTNPIAAILTEVRAAIVDPSAHSIVHAIGGGSRLLIPLGIVLVAFALGTFVFTREAPRAAEHL